VTHTCSALLAAWKYKLSDKLFKYNILNLPESSKEIEKKLAVALLD